MCAAKGVNMAILKKNKLAINNDLLWELESHPDIDSRMLCKLKLAF